MLQDVETGLTATGGFRHLVLVVVVVWDGLFFFFFFFFFFFGRSQLAKQHEMSFSGKLRPEQE
jgi:hypothetical protein